MLPLSLPVGIAVAFTLVCLFLGLRQRKKGTSVAVSPALILGFVSLELIVAALVNRQIVWFDTGLYHFGSIQWLSQFGAVPGVALINSKFGFTSSWYALAAPLTPEVLGSHVGAVTNGFVFLLAIGHFFIALSKSFTNPKVSDWFVIVFSTVVLLVYTATIFSGSPILISFSPDVAVTFLIGIVAWTILVISNQKKSFSANTRVKILDASFVPLIIAAGAVTIKLSALPLLPVVIFLIYLSKSLESSESSGQAAF